MGHPWDMIIDEEKTERKNTDIVLVRRLLSYVFPYKPRVFSIVTLVTIGSALSLLPAYLSEVAVDKYILKGDLQGLGYIALVFVAVYLSNWVVSYAQTFMTTWVGRRVEYDLRMSVFHKLQLLSLNYYDAREAGRIASRVTNDVDNLTELVTSGMVSMFADLFTLVAIVIIMLYMSASLALMAFVVIPAIIGFTWLFGRISREAYRKARRTISGVTAHVEETVSGIKEVQSYSKEQEASKEFEKANVSNLRANVSAARIQSTFFPAIGVFGALGTCIVLWAGGSAVSAGTMTIGVLLAFLQYMNRFFWPIQDLGMFYSNLQAAMAGAERVVDLLDMEVQVKEKEGAYDLPAIRGEVVFEHVAFGYVSQSPVLLDIDIRVRAKEMVAVAGPTGAGKTSLMNLLCRFYDPQQGRISVDGHDIRDVTLKSLRSQIGIVLQTPFLFSGSIVENIRYGKPDASDEEVMEAAKAVGLHEFVASLPEGYSTKVGERGGRLSMGQRQLVSFARALLRDPKILILDEATSSIDAYTELLIQKALSRILSERTSIVIAHRLSTIRNADRIVVIDKGRIVQEGSHDELIEAGGLYAHLYEMQFKQAEVVSITSRPIA